MIAGHKVPVLSQQVPPRPVTAEPGAVLWPASRLLHCLYTVSLLVFWLHVLYFHAVIRPHTHASYATILIRIYAPGISALSFCVPARPHPIFRSFSATHIRIGQVRPLGQLTEVYLFAFGPVLYLVCPSGVNLPASFGTVPIPRQGKSPQRFRRGQLLIILL